ncbi:hypothetical protein PoB_007401400 [Plakobranchus ocellatus]|uniref:Reelin domain-containing protein n=1 Tax=Plakobranchus ocellatus TaxID=259542 RepID=A0AAV4DTM1_9GAST|nr:hypothetical protein PoB_007401400 [Plakobranchus ocellatus]
MISGFLAWDEPNTSDELRVSLHGHYSLRHQSFPQKPRISKELYFNINQCAPHRPPLRIVCTTPASSSSATCAPHRFPIAFHREHHTGFLYPAIMSLLQLGLLLSILSAASAGQPDTSNSMQFTAILPQRPGVPLQIKCSFDAAKAKMAYVHFMHITQSKIAGEEDHAVTAMLMSRNNRVMEGRENMPFSNASGRIEQGAKSHLEFTFGSATEGYCRSYTCWTRCASQKYNWRGHEQTIHKTIQVNAINGGSCVGSPDTQLGVSEQTASQPLISEQTTSQPLICEQTTSQPLISEQTTSQPLISEQTTSEPLICEHTISRSSSIFSTTLLCRYSVIVGISIYMLIIQLFTY